MGYETVARLVGKKAFHSVNNLVVMVEPSAGNWVYLSVEYLERSTVGDSVERKARLTEYLMVDMLAGKWVGQMAQLLAVTLAVQTVESAAKLAALSVT